MLLWFVFIEISLFQTKLKLNRDLSGAAATRLGNDHNMSISTVAIVGKVKNVIYHLKHKGTDACN